MSRYFFVPIVFAVLLTVTITQPNLLDNAREFVKERSEWVAGLCVTLFLTSIPFLYRRYLQCQQRKVQCTLEPLTMLLRTLHSSPSESQCIDSFLRFIHKKALPRDRKGLFRALLRMIRSELGQFQMYEDSTALISVSYSSLFEADLVHAKVFCLFERTAEGSGNAGSPQLDHVERTINSQQNPQAQQMWWIPLSAVWKQNTQTIVEILFHTEEVLPVRDRRMGARVLKKNLLTRHTDPRDIASSVSLMVNKGVVPKFNIAKYVKDSELDPVVNEYVSVLLLDPKKAYAEYLSPSIRAKHTEEDMIQGIDRVIVVANGFEQDGNELTNIVVQKIVPKEEISGDVLVVECIVEGKERNAQVTVTLSFRSSIVQPVITAYTVTVLGLKKPIHFVDMDTNK